MFELIHTSAPRGLFGGSGYTTVAATQGMPDALRKVLESLSGYEQVFEYGSPQFHSNPEAYICQPIGQAAGKSWWVISRIVVADKDYTGRSNYLAHHVALDYNELTHAGPAALARTFPWMSSWAGEPRMLPVRSMPSIAAPAPPMAAPAWTRAGLDAGWAGHLAEQARSRRGIIQLVYPQTVDPLSLIADAVALLPPAERWDARFHTHTSRPRPDQAWAWFPAEAGATTDLARRPGVVYLAMRPPCPTVGPLVDQARGKAASIPAMGGAGNLNFHGSHGNAGLPVATAVATSTDPYAPAGRGAAVSWGAPPVPKKGALVGPILHWTAHGLMVVVMLVLAAMWLLEMQTVRKKDAEISEHVEEINKLTSFKTQLKTITKIDAREFKGVGKDSVLIDSNLSQELGSRIETWGNIQHIVAKEQLFDRKFQINDAGCRMSKDEAEIARNSWLEMKNKAESNAAKLASETEKLKAMVLPDLTIDMLGKKVPDVSDFKMSKKVVSDLALILERARPNYIYSGKVYKSDWRPDGDSVTIRYFLDAKQKKLVQNLVALDLKDDYLDKCIRAIAVPNPLLLPYRQAELQELVNEYTAKSAEDNIAARRLEMIVYASILEKNKLGISSLMDKIEERKIVFEKQKANKSPEAANEALKRFDNATALKDKLKNLTDTLGGWSPK